MSSRGPAASDLMGPYMLCMSVQAQGEPSAWPNTVPDYAPTLDGGTPALTRLGSGDLSTMPLQVLSSQYTHACARASNLVCAVERFHDLLLVCAPLYGIAGSLYGGRMQCGWH